MRHFLSAAMVLVALAGCATGSTPQSDLAAIEAGFSASFTAAKAYVTLPACGPSAPKLCSDDAIVVGIGKAATVAFIQIKAAEKIVADVKSAPSDIAAALSAAQSALSALQATIPLMKGA